MTISGGYDGAINFDTRIDETGFNRGMESMSDAAKMGVQEIWESLGDEKRLAILEQTMKRIGAAWDNLPLTQKGEELFKTLRSVYDIKDGVEDMIPIMKDWKGVLGGISKIISTVVPDVYKWRRAMRGVLEVAEAIKTTDASSKKTMEGAGSAAVSAGSAMTALQAIIAAVGASVVIVVVLILAALAAVAAAILGVIGIMTKSMKALWALEGYATEVKSAFEELKLAFATAFQPLLTAALPIILTIINWLTVLLRFIQMVVAAFMGQKQIMIATAGATGAAAGAANTLAENYREAGEAAKGALATFDELDVLQIEEEKPEVGGGGIPITFEMIDVDEGIWEVVQNIKQWFADAWLWVSTKAVEAWDWIVKTWEAAKTWFTEHIIDPWTAAFTAAWNWISEQATLAWNWIVETWGNAKAWIMENVINPYMEVFTAVWAYIGILAHNAWAVVKWAWGLAVAWFKTNVTDPWMEAFTAAWEWISTSANKAWAKLSRSWYIWLANVRRKFINPLKEAFGNAWEWVKEKANLAFEGLYNIIKGILNSLIPIINKFIKSVLGGINDLIAKLNAFGQSIPGWKTIPDLGIPVIPGLATGAVIPPNSAFAAVLGDQRSGTNIETPENLLRQIIREEGGGGESRDVIIRFEGDLGALVMQLKPFIDQENTRIGRSMLRSAS